MKKETIFITGAAGYIGVMLVDRFAKHQGVERIIGLDKEPISEALKVHEAANQKFVYVQMNTADNWEEKVRSYHPTIIIHTAWQIREMYGKQKVEWEWNIGGSDKVFNFAFSEPSVERLIHFSTVASYGAFADNTIEHRYAESEPFRKTNYLYAEEKRVAEEHLQEKYDASNKRVRVSVVRPAAITGPRGRFMRIRFGLQSSLSGSLKGQGSVLYDLISLMVSWVPVTPTWLRQYVHEDDVVNIVERLALGTPGGGAEEPKPVERLGFDRFNLCPPGPAVLGADMARAVGKRTLPVQPWMVRLAFFWFWHLTRGRVPTSPGSWKGYSYPIAVDGSRVTRELGYEYQYPCLDAFQYTDGEYESYVPEAQRKHKLFTGPVETEATQI